MRIWQIMWLKYDLTIASAFYYSQLGIRGLYQC